jgi:hypothetical protein
MYKNNLHCRSTRLPMANEDLRPQSHMHPSARRSHSCKQFVFSVRHRRSHSHDKLHEGRHHFLQARHLATPPMRSSAISLDTALFPVTTTRVMPCSCGAAVHARCLHVSRLNNDKVPVCCNRGRVCVQLIESCGPSTISPPCERHKCPPVHRLMQGRARKDKP